jgi:hypothetical protein
VVTLNARQAPNLACKIVMMFEIEVRKCIYITDSTNTVAVRNFDILLIERILAFNELGHVTFTIAISSLISAQLFQFHLHI